MTSWKVKDLKTSCKNHSTKLISLRFLTKSRHSKEGVTWNKTFGSSRHLVVNSSRSIKNFRSKQWIASFFPIITAQYRSLLEPFWQRGYHRQPQRDSRYLRLVFLGNLFADGAGRLEVIAWWLATAFPKSWRMASRRLDRKCLDERSRKT